MRVIVPPEHLRQSATFPEGLAWDCKHCHAVIMFDEGDPYRTIVDIDKGHFDVLWACPFCRGENHDAGRLPSNFWRLDDAARPIRPTPRFRRGRPPKGAR